jgi:hypothetical protein
MRRYRVGRDPYWLTARYDGTCSKCGERFRRGERVFWFPNGKRAYYGECANAEARTFAAAATAEQVTNMWQHSYERDLFF